MVQNRQDFADRFGVSRETCDRLQVYVELLIRWQSAQNLVSKSTLDQVWSRHIADSAQILGHCPDAQRWIDLGSGAGFPGLVIAILRHEQQPLHICLVESSNRKCAFMREVARSTGVAVEILATRIEKIGESHTLTPWDVVSARALAPMPKLLAYVWPFMSQTSVCLLPKGAEVEIELQSARQNWSFEATLLPSLTEPAARIVKISHLTPRIEGP